MNDSLPDIADIEAEEAARREALPAKQRTALELATGIDLAEHVLSGQTVAKAATDALTTNSQLQQMQKELL